MKDNEQLSETFWYLRQSWPQRKKCGFSANLLCFLSVKRSDYIVSIISDSEVAQGRGSHQKAWGTSHRIFFSAIPWCLPPSGQVVPFSPYSLLNQYRHFQEFLLKLLLGNAQTFQQDLCSQMSRSAAVYRALAKLSQWPPVSAARVARRPIHSWWWTLHCISLFRF